MLHNFICPLYSERSSIYKYFNCLVNRFKMRVESKLVSLFQRNNCFLKTCGVWGIRACSLQNVTKVQMQEALLKCSHDPYSVKTSNALEKVTADLSSIVPYFPPSFNVAAYVNRSEALQALFHLGVDLSKIEKKPYVMQKILKLDLVNDIEMHLFFLKDYVSEEEIGKFITKNPLILCEQLKDLSVRVNYLKSKSFSDINIKRIITANPFWLMFSTIRIDKRLGFFQEHFDLRGSDIRSLATNQPKLITYNIHHVKTNTFAIKEEMGFSDVEIKQLLLSKPKIWMLNHLTLIHRFKYIHNVMKIDHEILLRNPEVLLSRNFRIKQRHSFLQSLGRAQYNPSKENYVPIVALVEGTDSDFCLKYAKCSIHNFNVFLKTM